MSDETGDLGGAMAPPALPAGTEPESAPSASNLPVPTRSNIPTPASSVTGIPVASKLKAPSSFGSTGSVSKIGRPCCNHTTPKAGPPPRGEFILYIIKFSNTKFIVLKVFKSWLTTLARVSLIGLPLIKVTC